MISNLDQPVDKEKYDKEFERIFNKPENNEEYS